MNALPQTVALVLGPLLALSGCARPQPPAQEPPFVPTASIREIMDAETDPAADALWDSVSTTYSTAGEVTKEPSTPEDWQSLRRSAITLIESSNLIIMKGRLIAPPGKKFENETPTEVLQQRLDGNRPAFMAFAEGLRDIGLKALEMIDQKDARGLFDLGGEIDQRCEACHVVYWYPADAEPKR